MRHLAAALLLLFALPVSAAYTKNVAIVLYDGVEVLDFAGPGEVFQAASSFGRTSQGPAFRVYTVAATADPLVSQGFVKIIPEFTIENAPEPDIIVLPGGRTGVLLDNPKFMEWAKRAVDDADLTLTVCTGAFVLSKLQLLDGLDATTFYNAIDRLRRETPKARIHDGRRFIDNGRFVTTAGVSAGIDGSLHVVARLLGLLVAQQTAQYMEYRWTPEPYLITKYDLYNPSVDAAGRARQKADIDLHGRRFVEAAEQYRTLAAANANDSDLWMHLGFALMGAESYREAADAFMKAASSKDSAARAYYNAACALARAGEKRRAIESLEKAVTAGFRSKSAILGDEDLESLREDSRFQALIAGL